MISIILTVHNQEDLISRILASIESNISPLVKELIIINDGCTDSSGEKIERFITDTFHKFSIRYEYTPDIWETKANNVGLKFSTQEYSMIIQDDMVIEEKDFDARLIKPLLKWPEVFAVTARTAHDNIIQNGTLEHINLAGRETNLARNIFAIRDSCNRGPLLLRNSMLKKLDYLDESFAPLHLDDHDLCMRAYKLGGWLSGAYMINYRSDYEWGSSHKGNAAHIGHKAWMKNAEIIMKRHYDILAGYKHDEERILE